MGFWIPFKRNDPGLFVIDNGEAVISRGLHDGKASD
jgi:hypothetical protein